jgi:hypothetical protein
MIKNALHDDNFCPAGTASTSHSTAKQSHSVASPCPATRANERFQTPCGIVKSSLQRGQSDVVAQPKIPKITLSGSLIGYARVSTDEQGHTDPRRIARAAKATPTLARGRITASTHGFRPALS